MAISKRFITSVVLLCAAALIAGCGDSSTSPEEVTEAPLLPPTSIMITRAGDGKVLISWEGVTQPNLAGYNVYRASGRTSTTYTRLTTNPLQVTEYLDHTTAYNVMYKFRVVTVKKNGQESSMVTVQLFNEATSGGFGKEQLPKL
jgi:hypothetical protein